jgi:hypothetical protein
VLSTKLDKDPKQQKDRLRRQLEYTEALIENLLHPAVECVHLLLEREEDEAFIVQQILAYPHANVYARFIPKSTTEGSTTTQQRLWRYVQECGRVRFVMLGRWMLYSDAFGYARQLPGRVCVVQNSDISLSLSPEHVRAYGSLVDRATGRPARSIFTTSEGRNKVFVLSRSHVELPSCSSAAVRYMSALSATQY